MPTTPDFSIRIVDSGTLPTPYRVGSLPTRAAPLAATPAPAQSSLPARSPAPDPVQQKLQQIFANGQARGNRADVFSKVGDSITVSFNFLVAVGQGDYALGMYDYLQETINFYSNTNARQGNSFVNPSLAAVEGWAAWGALNPEFAPAPCNPGEAPLACEYRLVRPSVALIMYGTNDVGYRAPQQYEADLIRIVEISESMGVIPLLSTFPARPDVGAQVDVFNDIVRDLASARHLPLLDYHAALQGVTNLGLGQDRLHPSTPPVGFKGTADFSNPDNLDYGYVVRNLTALQALHEVRQLLDL